MRQTKYEFYRNGSSNQKRPDLIVDMRRADKSKIDQWTPEQRRMAAAGLTRWREPSVVQKGDSFGMTDQNHSIIPVVGIGYKRPG